MGCSCLKPKSSYESLIDDIFSSFPFRKLDMQSMIDKLNEISTFNEGKYFLSETNFQKFINTTLLPNKDSSSPVSNNRKPAVSFWLDFYKKKSYRYQLPLIKISLALLTATKNTKEEINMLYSLFDSYKHLRISYESVLSSPVKNHRNTMVLESSIKTDYLTAIITDYVYSISLLSVEHFSHYSTDKEDFTLRMKSLWDMLIIESFVVERIIKQSPIEDGKIKMRNFIKQHFDFLRDDSLIRTELTEYAKTRIDGNILK